MEPYSTYKSIRVSLFNSLIDFAPDVVIIYVITSYLPPSARGRRGDLIHAALRADSNLIRTSIMEIKLYTLCPYVCTGHMCILLFVFVDCPFAILFLIRLSN